MQPYTEQALCVSTNTPASLFVFLLLKRPLKCALDEGVTLLALVALLLLLLLLINPGDVVEQRDVEARHIHWLDGWPDGGGDVELRFHALNDRDHLLVLLAVLVILDLVFLAGPRLDDGRAWCFPTGFWHQ